jgi:hypothetical protein
MAFFFWLANTIRTGVQFAMAAYHDYSSGFCLDLIIKLKPLGWFLMSDDSRADGISSLRETDLSQAEAMLANYEVAGVHASRVGLHHFRSLRFSTSKCKLQLANNVVQRCFEIALLLGANVALGHRCHLRTSLRGTAAICERCFGAPLPSANVASGHRCRL